MDCLTRFTQDKKLQGFQKDTTLSNEITFSERIYWNDDGVT